MGVRRWWRRGGERPEPVRWVRVALARHEPEAVMLAGILADHGIPSFVRRAGGSDVPEMMAGGHRELLVPAGRALEAHALLDPLPPAGPEADG